MDAAAGGFRAKMKRADRSQAALALILGEDEHREGLISVKPLRGDAGQARLNQVDLADHLRKSLV